MRVSARKPPPSFDVIIAPTSTGRRAASSRPEIEIDGTRTRVLVEQLTVIDPQTPLARRQP